MILRNIVFAGAMSLLMVGSSSHQLPASEASPARDPLQITWMTPPSGVTVSSHLLTVTLVVANAQRVVLDGVSMERMGPAGWKGQVRLRPGTNRVAVRSYDDVGLRDVTHLVYEYIPEPGWLLAVGDSILRGVENELEDEWGEGTIDALVSRSMPAGLSVLERELQRTPRPEVVVVELGTNGGTDQRRVDRLMAAVADIPSVFVVSISAPFEWVPEANALLAEAALSHENVRLIDWHGLSSTHPEWFRPDLVHPNAAGRPWFVWLLIESLGSGYPAPSMVMSQRLVPQ